MGDLHTLHDRHSNLRPVQHMIEQSLIGEWNCYVWQEDMLLQPDDQQISSTGDQL